MSHKPSISPEEALQKLIEGNQRFTSGNMTHPNQNAARLKELTQGQHPFAVVLTCSDSRVSPEIIFDQGLGDIFGIQVAGNTLSDLVIGSIEYGVAHAGASVVMVLGHEKCGVATASIQLQKSGGDAEGHTAPLMDAFKPAIAKTKGQDGCEVENAARCNVELTVEALKQIPILADAVKKGECAIVGAYYRLETGKVELAGACKSASCGCAK